MAKTTREGFATLADEFRASLVDTKRMGFPLEVLEPGIRDRADAACRALVPILHRSHRMVLNVDYAALAADIMALNPTVLARYLSVARMPFSHLWLEWGQPDREHSIVAANYLKDDHIPNGIGLLIWPVNGSDTMFRMVGVQGYADSCAPAPIGMVFSLTEPVDHSPYIEYEDAQNTDNQKFIDECAIGFNWMDGVRKHMPEELPIAEQLSRYARITVAPPFGPLHRETIINALANKEQDVADRHQEWLGRTAREINGLFRFVIAVLGLYNTGGGEFIIGETKKQPRRAFRSGILPAYEYRILKLARPTRPEIIQQKLPPVPGTGIGHRQHTVPGSWHHRRLATAECARHPKACPIAVWQKNGVISQTKGDNNGEHQYECQICHRIRWFVPEHKRGNPKLGIVDKGYEIVSSTDDKRVRPSHRTVEVVDLPRNVRIKSIPRFAAIRDGDETNEHPRGRGHTRSQ